MQGYEDMLRELSLTGHFKNLISEVAGFISVLKFVTYMLKPKAGECKS